MSKSNLFVGFILFLLGLIGVFSILTMDIPLPEGTKEILEQKFSPTQIKLLMLINPIAILFFSVLMGTAFYQKVNLQVPVIEGFVTKKSTTISLLEIIKYGVGGGIIAGIFISIVALIFTSYLPTEFVELGKKLSPSLAARFLYGGITEEILMRFGLMTFIIWLSSKITSSLSDKIYWLGIIAAAILFAIGHFPIAFQAVSNPSAALLTYIVLGNSIGGLIFGWLYWKKGLESAMIAHAFTHLTMLLCEPLIN